MRFLFFRKKDAPRQGVLWQLKTHDREHLKTKHCHQCVLLRIENIWRKFSWRGSLCLLKAVYFELLSSQLPSRTEICDFRSHLGTHTHTHTHTPPSASPFLPITASPYVPVFLPDYLTKNTINKIFNKTLLSIQFKFICEWQCKLYSAFHDTNRCKAALQKMSTLYLGVG